MQLPELTIESVRDNFDAVMDPSAATISVIDPPDAEFDVGARPYGGSG